MCLSNEIITVIYNTYKKPPLLLLVHLLAKKGDAGRYANDDRLGFTKSVIKFAFDIVHSKLGY